jgi:hypothetical protein
VIGASHLPPSPVEEMVAECQQVMLRFVYMSNNPL